MTRLLQRFFPIFLTALLTSCSFTPSKQAQTPDSTPPTTRPLVSTDTTHILDLTRTPTDLWERVRRGFAIPDLDSELVQQWTEHYAAHPQSIARMAERASKYLYFIIDALNQRGLPTELALLPFIESAYSPTAYSRSQAAGLWQFVPSTGHHYKLTQNVWHDERRDPVASTLAALDYLEYLFEFQGDWHLALASYNCGEGAVRRAIKRNAGEKLSTEYPALSLPEQTRNYVPKLQAIKNIIADPGKYGVTLPRIDNEPYFEIVPKTRSIDVALAAQFAHMSPEEFYALNPALNRPVILSAHTPKLLLPRDRVEIFKTNLKTHQGQLLSWKVYRPKRDESLAAIAKRHNISLADLRRINNLPAAQRNIGAGELIVPTRATHNAQIARLALPPGARPGTPVRTHTVRPGDTLYDLARHYGTSVQKLRTLNGIQGNKLRIGLTLRVPGARG